MKGKHFLTTIVASTFILSSLLYLKSCIQTDKVASDTRVHKEDRTQTQTNLIKERVKRNDFVYGTPAVTGKITFPGKNWTATLPENVGWSSLKLEEAKSFYENLNGDALLVIVDGFIIASWGDPNKVISAASMRKSFLSSLFGIHSEKIDLTRTIGELGMDDKEILTKQEKEATLADLLTSRSGVYHPAAYTNKRSDQPLRGEHEHGTFFFYNNWDFNALGYIFNNITGNDLFTEFNNKIAQPLSMQDFKLENTEYRFESKSKYPAYLFSTSARDDARFGLLYLTKGNWNGTQIVPQDWVAKSTSRLVETNYGNGYAGYGYLWWVEKIGDADVFLSRGNGAQYIFVDPSRNLVVVFRADPGSLLNKWLGMRVKEMDSWELLQLIIRASPRIP